LGTHLADEIFDEGVSAAIAAFLDQLEDLPRRIIVALDQSNDLSLE